MCPANGETNLDPHHENGSDDEADSSGGEAEAARRLYVAEPVVAVRLAALGRLRAAAIVLGVSVWSPHQLLGEIARGAWGLCRGRAGDVALPAMGETRHAAEAGGRAVADDDHADDVGGAQAGERRHRAVFALWSGCWRERSPMCVEAQVNPMMMMLR